MRKFKTFLFLCSLFVAGVTSSKYQEIDLSAKIDKTAILGSYIKIDKGVIIKANVEIKNYAKILSNTSIAENSIIGQYSVVDERCSIQNNVQLVKYVKIGKDNVIGSNNIFDDYAQSYNNAKFGNRNKVGAYAEVWNDTEIKDDSILDQYSKIQNNGSLHQKVYIGRYSRIGENSIINELAVVHTYAKVEISTTVKEREVVIPTPSSYKLYRDAEFAEKILSAEVELSAKDTGSISPEFNSLLKGLIEAQLEKLKTNCDKTNTSTKLHDLATIRSLYLIRVHGLDRFNEYKQKVHKSISNTLLKQLQNELHLCGVSEINVLESDVKKKFIQLLTIYEDEKRPHRVENDFFCDMFAQIQKEERQIMCAANVEISNQSNVATINFTIFAILIATPLLFLKF